MDTLKSVDTGMGPKNKFSRNNVWKHYKGALYKVIDVVEHTETGEWLVVYEPLYGERRVWARPLNMWEDDVDGVPRFTWVREY